ncbi:MAG: class I SAM-dependent methyltransferase [Clostridiaceae bacterium]|nr:class I SAM-dependent methyltransferase [Clostridiaceae bacterium]
MTDKINLQWYDANYVYSDGEIEQEVLQELENGVSPATLLEEDYRWPILYHFSPERHAALDWIDAIDDADVLEIGSGWGAITGCLCERARHVTCVELSLIRSQINAIRNKNYSNFGITVANLNDIPFEKQFDVVTLIGVLEYCGRYTEDSNPYEAFLQKAFSLLKPGGTLVLAIENRLGLKYFAGANEDHYNRPFEGLNNYPNDTGIRTFSYEELTSLINTLDNSSSDFFLPFPDYKFAQTIIAADDMTHYHEAFVNEINYGAYSFSSFDQSTVFRTLAEQSDLKTFANSFIVLIRKDSAEEGQ